MSAQPTFTLHSTSPLLSSNEDEAIELVVRRLNSICKAATFDFTLAIGAVVIQHLFGGDLSQWRSRDPNKSVSLRKLARHPHLPMSPSALYRSIAIYELCERLDIRRWRHVSTSHIRLVLSLPEHEQARLLRMAETNAWSVRRLDEEIETTMGRDGEQHRSRRGGRKRSSPLVHAAKRVAKSLEQLMDVLDNTEDALPEKGSEMTESIAVLRRAAEVCAALHKSVLQEETAPIVGPDYQPSEPGEELADAERVTYRPPVLATG